MTHPDDPSDADRADRERGDDFRREQREERAGDRPRATAPSRIATNGRLSLDLDESGAMLCDDGPGGGDVLILPHELAWLASACVTAQHALGAVPKIGRRG